LIGSLVIKMAKKNWIKKVTDSIKRRGTEGVCTGSKFGGPTCRPGTKRYNLAKTFKKMNKKQKGGNVAQDKNRSTLDSLFNVGAKTLKNLTPGQFKNLNKNKNAGVLIGRERMKQHEKMYNPNKKKCGGSVLMCGGEYHKPVSKSVGPNKIL